MRQGRSVALRLAMALALPAMSMAAAQAQSQAQAQAQTHTPARFVSERPAARVDYWQKRAADIGRQLAVKHSLRSVRLLFVGDSITDFWHLDGNPWFPGQYCGRAIWDESFSGAVPAQKALNLGVSGDRIEHVLHRLLPTARGGEGWLDRPDLQPDAIFLMLGVNNSFDSETPATTSIYKGVVAVVARLRERKPKTRIIIQSLLPTDDAAKNRDLIVPVNRLLNAYAASAKGVAYLDLYRSFVDETGGQRRSLFNDSLHPSRDGYRVWRDRLVEFLRAEPLSAPG